MNPLNTLLSGVIIVCLAPLAIAEQETDCLLQGTVQHGNDAGQNATRVKIHSVSKYDDDATCKVRRSQKVEFKLPQDNRLQEAPSGSEVKYRYRTDTSGATNAELISVGA